MSALSRVDAITQHPDLSFRRLPELEGAQPQTRCLYAPVQEAFDHLAPAEAAMLVKAVAKRRNEYSTARWLAHRALKMLGLPKATLLSGQSREPLWPRGIVGSITHSDMHAVVLISSDPELAGLGVDLEKRGRLTGKIINKVLTAREQADSGNIDPTLVFSAKEAVYKLLFPIVREYIDFLDVEVSIDMQRSTFSLRYIGDNQACGCIEAATGIFMEIDGCWLTQVSLRQCGVS